MTGRNELETAAGALDGAMTGLSRLNTTEVVPTERVVKELNWAVRLIGEAKDAVVALEDRPWYEWLWDSVRRMVGRGE
jgi:hypothetical protein